jgi:hypothetical protein
VPALTFLGSAGAALAWTIGQCLLVVWLRSSLRRTKVAQAR